MSRMSFELLGNVADNAAKWALRRVSVRAWQDDHDVGVLTSVEATAGHHGGGALEAASDVAELSKMVEARVLGPAAAVTTAAHDDRRQSARLDIGRTAARLG